MKRLFTLCTLLLTTLLTVCAQVTPTVDSAGEVSYFLEAPQGEYHVWPWDNSGNGGGEYTNAEWPGATMTDKGALSNGRHLYKWTCGVSIGTPTNVIITKVENDTETKLIDTGASNHTYFLSTDGKTASIHYIVGTAAPANSHSTYGHRVIYELNVGSFTSAGTFNAAKDRLQYLKDLGIDVIWLMPIYPRGGGINSPYAATDFTKTNSSYGSVSDLKSFVDAAHAKNMDVILDWVPNHVATNSVWASSHPEYINKNSDGSFKHPNGYGDVIELNYSTVGNEMTRILKDWMDKAGVDGFRFDYISSPTIPNSYWLSMSKELRAKKPNVILLGEGDLGAVGGITKSCFDYDYAWGFNDDMRRFGLGSTNFSTFKSKVQSFLNNLNGFDISRMLYLSNHDNNWNGDNVTKLKSMKEVFGNHRYTMTVMEFTLPGMPLVYNGQELNGTMALNYFEDTKINWNATDANMTNLIKALAQMKHTYAALGDGNNPMLRGETNMLNVNGSNVMAYERVQGNDRVLVVVNLSGSQVNATVQGVKAGKWTKVLSGGPSSVNTNATSANYTSDMQVSLSANGYAVYVLGEASSPEIPDTPDNPVDPSDPDEPATLGDMYFVTEDSWGNPTAHQMTKSSENNDYAYFNYTINRNEFDGYQEKAPISIKVPDGWANAALYIYKDDKVIKDGWPGITGTKNGDYYEFTLDDVYYVDGCSFIINDKNKEQMDINLTINDTKDYLYFDIDGNGNVSRRTEANPLYFKFSNDGSSNFYGAGDNAADTYFGESGKEIAYTATTTGNADGGAAYSMTKPADDVEKIVITVKASKQNAAQGTVKVDFVTGNTPEQPDQPDQPEDPEEPVTLGNMYFVTEDSWGNPTAHQMTKIDDEADYTCFTYTISAADFDSYQEPLKAKVFIKAPADWNDAALYAYKNDAPVKELWPGIVSKSEGEYFTLTLTEEYYADGCYFIVNNNNGGQQLDIDLGKIADNTAYYLEVIDVNAKQYNVSTAPYSDPLYFKFSNDGSGNFYGAGDNAADTYFGESGKEIAYMATTTGNADGGAAYSMTKPADDVEKIVITVKASKQNAAQGTVKVDFVTSNTPDQPDQPEDPEEPVTLGNMYFVTEDSWGNPTAHQMTKIDDEADYTCFTYTISAADFDSYQEPLKAKVFIKAPADWNDAALYAYKNDAPVKELWPGIVSKSEGEYFTLTLTEEYYADGCYFIVNNNNGGQQLDIDLGKIADNTAYYLEVIDVNAMQYNVSTQPYSDPLYFKFSNDGSGNFYGAGDNAADTYFGESGKEIAYTATTTGYADGGAAFSMPKPAADIESIVVTLKASKQNPANGIVKVNLQTIQKPDDISTAIKQATAVQSATIYDLSGRKVAPSAVRKGIYIVNGKKTVL